MERSPELIVALDVPSMEGMAAALNRMPDQLAMYKVGLELFTREGPPVLQHLQARAKRVFLDLKMHDIPRTVARAVTAAVSHGATMLTVHASGGRAMLAAASEAARDSAWNTKVIAVTTLTSLDEQDLADIGVTRRLADHTLALADMAMDAGADGLVCSPREVRLLRDRLGPQPTLVTPGVRPRGGAVGDQKRIATAGEAVRDGADFIVVGRPILEAADPAAAAQAILNEISDAQHQRQGDAR